MIKRLLQVGIILAGFASMPSWAILINDGGAYDGTDVGGVDTFIAEADKVGNSDAEEDWVNLIIGGGAEWTVKTEDVTYFGTDMTDVFAIALASDSPGYFLVKNSTRMALFENLADFNWGVFNANDLSEAMNIGDYTISHVLELNGRVPEPGIVGLLSIGLLGMVVARRRTKV